MTASTPKHADVFAAMAHVASQLPRFTHDDKVGGRGGYGFTSVDAIQDALRPMFAEAGIMYAPTAMHVLTDEEIERHRTDNDGVAFTQYQHRVTVYTEWTFWHTPSSTMIVVPSLGEAMDTADKAMNKAMTAARKYALINAFNITTGEDGDKERTGDDTGERSYRGQGGGARPASPKQINYLKGLLSEGRKGYDTDAAATDALIAGATGVVMDGDLPALRTALDEYAYGADGHVSNALAALPAPVVSKLIDLIVGK